MGYNNLCVPGWTNWPIATERSPRNAASFFVKSHFAVFREYVQIGCTKPKREGEHPMKLIRGPWERKQSSLLVCNYLRVSHISGFPSERFLV